MSNYDAITKAKIGLVHNEPFFATVALGMQFQADTTIKTGNINGKVVRYNPEWIAKLNAEQVKGWLASEVLHIAGLHHTRRNGREAKRWNLACDHAINGILKEAGFTLPDESTIDQQYHGKAAEDIYSLLPAPPPEQQPDNGDSGDDPGGNGGVQDAPGDTQAQVDQQEAETKQLISQAAIVAKQAGKLPGSLEHLVNESLQARVDWKEVLSAFLTENARNDYTFKRPNPRYINTGMFLPVLESIERGRFVLLIDTSGSVFSVTGLLNEFAGEMQSILGEVASGFTVIHVDTQVREIQEIEQDDTLVITPKGGGGTDFRPGFAVVEDEPAAAIYFTDGYCNSFPPDPGYPVLWAVYNNSKFIPPFGEVITVETHEKFN